jgi:hypothetical protein
VLNSDKQYFRFAIRMNTKPMFIVAAMTVMLVGATALATEDAFADKIKKYDKNQATSIANACGNDKLPMSVYCQNIHSQVQGEENAVAIDGVQSNGEDRKDKKDASHELPPSKTDLAKLGDAWWQWAYNLDTEDVGNPFGDNSLSCTLGQQSGGLLFLTGTAGIFTPEGGVEQGETDFTRSCTVKAGTQLFIPLLVTECSPIEFGLTAACGNTPEELRASANELMNPDFINSLTLEIDGVSIPIEKLLQYNRAESPGDGFSLTIAPNNAFGLNENTMVPPPVTLPETVNSVAVGYWALLHPLPPGEHTIKFGGSITYPELISGTFRTEVTYLLNVVQGH